MAWKFKITNYKRLLIVDTMLCQRKSISLVILSRINSKRCSKPQWHKVYLLANTAVAVVIYKLLKAQKKERKMLTYIVSLYYPTTDQTDLA